MDLQHDDARPVPEETAERGQETVEGGRRAFLKGTSLAALTAMMGVGIPFGTLHA
jgi:hypothetical protein